MLTGVPSFQESVASADAVLYDGSGTITHGGSHEVVVTQDNEVQVTTTTFEGGGNVDPIHPLANFEIPGSGMRFPGWLTVIERAEGGSGGFCNEPSPATAAFWLEPDGSIPSSRDILFNEPVAGVSFFYTSFVDVTVEAFDADGNLVESDIGAGNFDTGDPCPPTDPPSNFNQWDPLGVDVGENVITRVQISGNSNQTAIDDFTTFEKDRARAIVEGEEGGTVTINDESGNPTAGIEIPEGAFEGEVEFTIQLFDLDDPECTSPAALLIDAIGQCLSIQTDPPDIELDDLVTVGICIDLPPGADPNDIHVYRVSGDIIQRLENVPAPFLACDPEFVALNEASGFWGHARALFERTTRWLQPEPLYATRRIALIDRGFGGHTDIFSEFLWGLPGVVINPSTINCRNDNGMITVAILGREEFDVEDVDHTTVTFEGASEIHVDGEGEPRLHLEDVNGDGLMDMVFHFRFGDTGLTCESTSGQIQGELTDETKFMGSDLIRMNEPRGQRP